MDFNSIQYESRSAHDFYYVPIFFFFIFKYATEYTRKHTKQKRKPQ